MGHCYLVRHGEHGPEGRNDDKLGYGLTRLGVRQAKALARRFREVPVTSLHASTLLRAIETARIVAEQLPRVRLHTSDDLWEAIPNVPREFKAELGHLSKSTTNDERPAGESTASTHGCIDKYGNIQAVDLTIEIQIARNGHRRHLGTQFNHHRHRFILYIHRKLKGGEAFLTHLEHIAVVGRHHESPTPEGQNRHSRQLAGVVIKIQQRHLRFGRGTADTNVNVNPRLL